MSERDARSERARPYFEVARVEFLRRQGHAMADVDQKIRMPVVEARVRYHKPAVLDDLQEGAQLERNRTSSAMAPLTEFDSAIDGRDVRDGREHDDRRSWVFAVYARQCFVAVHARHDEVEENNVNRLRAQRLDPSVVRPKRLLRAAAICSGFYRSCNRKVTRGPGAVAVPAMKQPEP